MRRGLDLRARLGRVHAEYGVRQVAARSWARAWMTLAGLPLIGRAATRVAVVGSRPFSGRHRLAAYNRRGFTAPTARISHPQLERGINTFVGDRVVILREEGGGHVRLGDRAHVNDAVYIVTAHGGSVTVGADTHIQPRCHLMAVLREIRLGRNVQIGPNCAFYPYDHGTAAGQSIYDQALESRGDIELGDDVWLGHGVVVLAGVTIGAGAVVGAGSVVTRDIPPEAIAAGSPARVLRMRA